MEGDTDYEVDEELERDVESLREVLESTKTSSEAVATENTTLQQLQACLKKNLEVQADLYTFLENLDQALKENRTKRERLKSSGRDCFKQACTLLKFRKSKSYFRDYAGKCPDLQCDFVLPTRKNYYFEETTWNSDTDDSVLKKHVIVQAIEIVSRPQQEKLSQTTDEEEIKRIKVQIKELSNLSYDDRLLLDVDPDEINWIVVAQEAFNNQKTPFECYQRWINGLSPAVSVSPWTKEETIKLMKLGKEFEGRRWKEIAEKVGTHRSVFSYFQKYQTTFTDTRAKCWSKESDQKLREAAKQYTSKINWYDVAKHVGLSAGKCRQRWSSHVNPNIKKGRWTNEEDKLLREAYAKYGTMWRNYSNMVPNRTPTQCRERWVNVLDPKLEKGFWKPEEDRKLMELCKEYNGKVISWAKVAAALPNRTDSSCLVRWRILSSPDEIAKYHKTVKMKSKIKHSGCSTLELTDFDDDMIPKDVQDEIEVYQKQVQKRTPLKDKEGTPAKPPPVKQPPVKQPPVKQPPIKPQPVKPLDIGNLFTADQLKHFGAVPISQDDIPCSIPSLTPIPSTSTLSSATQFSVLPVPPLYVQNNIASSTSSTNSCVATQLASPTPCIHFPSFTARSGSFTFPRLSIPNLYPATTPDTSTSSTQLTVAPTTHPCSTTPHFIRSSTTTPLSTTTPFTITSTCTPLAVNTCHFVTSSTVTVSTTSNTHPTSSTTSLTTPHIHEGSAVPNSTISTTLLKPRLLKSFPQRSATISPSSTSVANTSTISCSNALPANFSTPVPNSTVATTLPKPRLLTSFPQRSATISASVANTSTVSSSNGLPANISTHHTQLATSCLYSTTTPPQLTVSSKPRKPLVKVVAKSAACKLSAPQIYSSFNKSPIRKLSSKEAQQLVQKGVPLLTVRKSAHDTKTTGQFPPSNVTITVKTPLPLPQQQKSVDDEETRPVPTAKFDSLVDSIQSGEFNHECFVAQKAEICNERDVVVFTYEDNPHTTEVRRKRSYRLVRRNPSRKKKKMVPENVSESENEYVPSSMSETESSDTATTHPVVKKKKKRHKS